MNFDFKELKSQFKKELTDNILKYWTTEVYDSNKKIFIGKIDNNNKKYPEASVSAVYISRILWTFSAAYRVYPTPENKKMAEEAFRIVIEDFWDEENGGIFWSVFAGGKPEETKKHFYAQAFFIYALSEYYLAFRNEKAKQIAVSLFMLIESFGYDSEFGGYFEAASANWEKPTDQRLSEKDLDTEKSMNTHLHILEAYTNLYRIFNDNHLKKRLKELINIFQTNIINTETGHLFIYFNKNWAPYTNYISYGHDIETTWLLCEAAEVLGDKTIIKVVKDRAVELSEIFYKEGVAKHGGIYHEKIDGNLLEQFDWWVQAESVIGFFNSWQISGDKKFLQQALKSWEFIQQNIIDKKYGEWIWGVDSNLKPLSNNKTCHWKSSYHNSRMCLEMVKRIQKEIS